MQLKAQHVITRSCLLIVVDLMRLISSDKENVRDLIYSVMTSRPVVIVELAKSKDLLHECIARALSSFIPFQYRYDVVYTFIVQVWCSLYLYSTSMV